MQIGPDIMTNALPTDLRKQLENAIKEARRVAEPGAHRALEALAVDQPRAHDAMDAEERELRNRLRAHGRHLGDRRDPRTGAQETDRLAREVAYEHWHRMLFARFLAENQLLIEPEAGVAISIAESEDLARQRGEDPWAFAGRAAARMLPRIFRPDDPALAVVLAPETRQALERLLASLPPEVFTADDALGWTYQFWQAERKDAVNASGVKIGADELPAVTQLFTEHYMVQFLFHNTIGAWRAAKLLHEKSELAERAESEDDLRRAVRIGALDGYDFSYLRFVREAREGDEEGKPSGPWRPAAGGFPGWPRRAAELRVLDPCCGSGHFLVEGFELLVRLRMEEEGLALEDAIPAVLEDNLFGLEIDPRCTQIAAFNLALAAWKLAGKPIELPPLRIACAGFDVGSSRDEWTKLAPECEKNLRIAMGWLYDEFKNARELGSLLDPSRSSAAKLVPWTDIQPLLDKALEREDVRRDPEATEAGISAQGLARAAVILSSRYHLVATNPPFLGTGKQSAVLKRFLEDNYPRTYNDLAYSLFERAISLADRCCSISVVLPQNWTFAKSSTEMREQFLSQIRWSFLVRLGEGGFESAQAAGGFTALFAASKVAVEDAAFAAIDCSEPRGPVEKARSLVSKDFVFLHQSIQRENPNSRVSFVEYNHRVPRLSQFADAFQGLVTGDIERFVRKFWEVSDQLSVWRPLRGSTDCQEPYQGITDVLFWQGGRGELHKYAQATRGQLHDMHESGNLAWGKRGVAINRVRNLRAALTVGEAFHNNVAVIVPKKNHSLRAIWNFCSSSEFFERVREIDQKLSVTNRTLLDVPFEPREWTTPSSTLPSPESSIASQWVFHGNPAAADPDAALQVAVARLLGYRWPPEHDPDMELAEDARACVERCRELDGYADEDGIVCLSALRGEACAADRLRALLAAAFGSDWSAAEERELLVAAAQGGKVAGSLEEWLRDRFFEEHCKLFHHRPFVWHIWDGVRDGFHALVSYHRLAGPDGEGRRTLEALTYSYLGDWIARQRAEQREGTEGADGRLAAALDLQTQLERILEGEPPLDLFVRWKPLHRQPIGWEPDIDDGVRLNIRPFLRAELRTGGRKGAGLLRWKPNIRWKKDRGKEPQSLRPKEEYPLFWSCPGNGTQSDRTDFAGGEAFDGNRWNDLHYTNATKRRARERAEREDRG